ncbi:hypothetical protein Hanom_Chr13g01202571 [Helianthus anomalus]
MVTATRAGHRPMAGGFPFSDDNHHAQIPKHTPANPLISIKRRTTTFKWGLTTANSGGTKREAEKKEGNSGPAISYIDRRLGHLTGRR